LFLINCVLLIAFCTIFPQFFGGTFPSPTGPSSASGTDQIAGHRTERSSLPPVKCVVSGLWLWLWVWVPVSRIWGLESGIWDALQCDSRWYAHFTLNFHLLPAGRPKWPGYGYLELDPQRDHGHGCVDFHRFSRHFDCFIVALSARRPCPWRPWATNHKNAIDTLVWSA